MSEIIEFKCPFCGGKLEFDASTQKMKCPYCDSEVDVASLQGKDEAPEAEMPQAVPEEPAADDGVEMNVYSCKSCGGEIVADETTGATHCPYCGNPVVMTSKFSGSLKPDLIIPFSVTKEQAKAALKELYKGKKLLPKVFSEENHLDEIKGVYVPFWLFDAVANGIGKYKMENLRTWSDNNFSYTERSVFEGLRSGTLEFRNLPVDGAKKIPDDMMESIEPFDTSKAVPFQNAFLSGFLADKYDVQSEDCEERAKSRITNTTEGMLLGTVSGYGSVTKKSCDVTLSECKSKYALFPVWILTTSFGGKQYLFAVNGQTGKIVGDLPEDKSLSLKYKLIYTLAAGAAVYGVGLLIMLLGGMI